MLLLFQRLLSLPILLSCIFQQSHTLVCGFKMKMANGVCYWKLRKHHLSKMKNILKDGARKTTNSLSFCYIYSCTRRDEHVCVHFPASFPHVDRLSTNVLYTFFLGSTPSMRTFYSQFFYCAVRKSKALLLL